MAVRLALRRSQEDAARWQRSDSFRMECIAFAHMAHGSGARCAAAASPEAVWSVWRSNAPADAQPLRWCAKEDVNAWASSDENMAASAGGGGSLAAADVGEADTNGKSASPNFRWRRGILRPRQHYFFSDSAGVGQIGTSALQA